MSYTINLSNGNLLTTIADGTFDSITDLTLVGKNITSYGQQLNENFVYLLENFAGVAEPSKPLYGQLWFDATANGLKVYTTTGWRTAGGPIVSDQEPLVFNTGDLWVDNLENQIWFHTGTDLVLAGPIYKKSQGLTGFITDTINDSQQNPRVILYLYVNDTVLGIYAADNFTPSPPIPGFSNGLAKGYTPNSNVSSITGGTSYNSTRFNNLTESQFMRSDRAAINSEGILIQSNNGLSIGSNQGANFKIDNTTLVIENVLNSGPISLSTQNITGKYNAIYIDASTNHIGMWTVTPQQALDVAGNVRIRGDLTIEGTSTVINSTFLSVDDKNIELAVVNSQIIADSANITNIVDQSPPLTPGVGPWLITVSNLSITQGLVVGQRVDAVPITGNLGSNGSVSIQSIVNATTITVLSQNGSAPILGSISKVKVYSATDFAADGGGIIIKGTTDKTILYNLSLNSFNFSENINLKTGKSLSIGGVQVLSQHALSSAITSAPGLTTIGNQISLRAGDLVLANNTISSTVTNQDIELNPNGLGNITLISKVINGTTVLPRITGVGLPLDYSDAVPKNYLTSQIQLAPLSLTFIDNGLTANINANIILLLNDIAATALFTDGKLAYVHVQHLGAGSPPVVTRYLKRFKIQNKVWIFDSELTSSI